MNTRQIYRNLSTFVESFLDRTKSLQGLAFLESMNQHSNLLKYRDFDQEFDENLIAVGGRMNE